ncbi:MAG: STN domain-containing protein [Cyclobacteriaceae bacterium]|nr:STN domain-containing protein [Cyclobacteriaceae bacterium]
MRIFYSFLFLLAFTFCAAQTKDLPLLERPVTLSAENEKITLALNRIAQSAGFSFSYNSSLIDPDQVISINAQNLTVRQVLNEIFQGALNYKAKGNYVILTKAPAPPVKNNIVTIIVSGYVEDAHTGNKLPQVSIYHKPSITSVTADQYGFFRMKIEKRTDSLQLSVSKKDYRDTLIQITASANQYYIIAMKPVVHASVQIDLPEIKPDSAMLTALKEELAHPYSSEPNVQNISDTLYALAQVSILPFVGTNGKLSANVINDYSINFLGGYSMGMRQIELGFFFNLDRGDVRWLQIAGFGNMVGGDVYGIQAAGFFNLNGGSATAVQLAGFANTNLSDGYGVQVAGFSNTNLGEMNGVQVAGFSNYNNYASYGVQVAGFGNLQRGTYRGSQFAGVTNIATDKISGSQISGLFNYAGRVKGTQIGLINYADSVGGVPIGLFSIVNKGYHKIELSADEVFPVNLAFRTGVRKFYTILAAGFKPERSIAANDTSVWTFGYGLGTSRKLTRWWYLDFDIVSQHVNKGSFTNALSLLNKAYLGFDFQLAKKFSVSTGVTFNAYLTHSTFTDYPKMFTYYTPSNHSVKVGTDNNLSMWFGAKVGLRFL